MLVVVAPQVVARWAADDRDPKLTLLHLPPFTVLDRDGRASWDGVQAVREQAFTRADYDTLATVYQDRKYLSEDPRLLTMGAVLLYEDEEGTYALPHPLLHAAIGQDSRLMVDAAVAGNMP
jgi:hypothetical protein